MKSCVPGLRAWETSLLGLTPSTAVDFSETRVFGRGEGQGYLTATATVTGTKTLHQNGTQGPRKVGPDSDRCGLWFVVCGLWLTRNKRQTERKEILTRVYHK
jgi:hypothetical protein